MLLREENDFIKYLDMLNSTCKRYTVIFSVKGTPGKFINKEIAAKISAFGITYDGKTGLQSLYNKHFHSYIGIIDKGNIIHESISEKNEAVHIMMKYRDTSLQVTSKSLNAGNISEIIIDDNEYSVNKRGLNIVVFDRITKMLIDSVCFDTEVNALTCTHYNNIIDFIESQIITMHAAGYSIPQYCIDNNIKNIVLYTEKKYWNVVLPIALSFRMNRKIILKSCVSDKPYKKYFINKDQHLGIFETKQFDLNNISVEDTVISLNPIHNNRVEKQCQVIGVSVLQLPELLNTHYVLYYRPIINFINNHLNVPVLSFTFPEFPKSDLTENETEIVNNNISRARQYRELQNGKILTSSWNEFGYTVQEICEMSTPPNWYMNSENIPFLKDMESKHLNVSNGHRITTGNPENYDRTIFLIGNCHVFGVGVPDWGTIASHLQRKLNEYYENNRICVLNYGAFHNGRRDNMGLVLNSLNIKENDIVILPVLPSKTMDIISPFAVVKDLKNIFQRPHSFGEVFTDKSHYNENGCKAIADELFNVLNDNNFFESYTREKLPPLISSVSMFGIPENNSGQNQFEFNSIYSKELCDYKNMLTQTHSRIFGRIGSIVMNCNPFTLGHRYLIEYAASQVKHLYIFAVEEDKSIFPFSDRFELIKAGTSDLLNVTVIPSGKFIISSLTFSDYFNKSELQDRTIDPSMDVSLFGKEIAPKLNITVRFAGEEPLDKVTKQYNDTMKRVLPSYGIEFIEIPRKEFGGKVISATLVRKHLKNKNYDEIKNLVPATTYEYLLKFPVDQVSL